MTLTAVIVLALIGCGGQTIADISPSRFRVWFSNHHLAVPIDGLVGVRDPVVEVGLWGNKDDSCQRLSKRLTVTLNGAAVPIRRGGTELLFPVTPPGEGSPGVSSGSSCVKDTIEGPVRVDGSDETTTARIVASDDSGALVMDAAEVLQPWAYVADGPTAVRRGGALEVRSSPLPLDTITVGATVYALGSDSPISGAAFASQTAPGKVLVKLDERLPVGDYSLLMTARAFMPIIRCDVETCSLQAELTSRIPLSVLP